MTDVIDLAQRHEQMRREIGLGEVLDQAQQLATPREDLACIDCAETIETERRAVCPGAIRCIVCQAAAEARQRLFPRGPR